MTKYYDIVNDHTLNIFSDASILQRKTNNGLTFIGCPGISVWLGNIKIDQYSEVYADTTNNFCEITAIRQAVFYANKWRYINPNIDTINIFADSKICIFGLRQWIYNWVRNQRSGILYSTSGEVKNQEVFIDIINYIMTNNLNVRFYHVRGHHDHNTYKELQEFRNSFRRENNINGYPEDQLMKYLIAGNSDVDHLTRVPLTNQDIIEEAKRRLTYQKPITFDHKQIVDELNLKKYTFLINK